MEEDVDKNLTMRIVGPVMEADGGFDLSYLVDTLDSFEKIIEKTYLHSYGKSRMSEEDRDNLKIILKNPSKGSFVAEVAIQIHNLTLALSPLIAQNGPAIWTAIKKTYEYLKLVIDAKKKGEQIVIHQHADGNLIVNTGTTGDITVSEFPSYVKELGEKLYPEFENMTKNIDENKVNSINFMDEDFEQSISLDNDDKERFRTSISVSEDKFELRGQITIANSNSFTGKIDIHENEYGIEPREYSFTVNKDLSNKSFFRAKYLVVEEYVCLLRFKVDFSKGLENTIHNIHIVSALE